jgi:hypothetical protein
MANAHGMDKINNLIMLPNQRVTAEPCKVSPLADLLQLEYLLLEVPLLETILAQ